MLSYADLMNNFGGPSPMDLVPAGATFYVLDEERPKREGRGKRMELKLLVLTPIMI